MFPHPEDVLTMHRREVRRVRLQQEWARTAAGRRQVDNKDVLRSADRDAS